MSVLFESVVNSPSYDDRTLRSSSRKGKARVTNDVDADEEYALELQTAFLKEVTRDQGDLKFAESFGNATRKEEDYTTATSDRCEEAAENRAVMLASSVAVGFPGPSLSKHSEDVFMGSSLAPLVPFPDVASADKNEEKTDIFEILKAQESLLSPDLLEPPELDIRLILGEQFGYPTVYCLVCEDLIVGEPTLLVSCGHYYCVDCICDLVKNCTRDETLYPPKCCSKAIPQEDILPFLTIPLGRQFLSKREELGVPSGLRVFCPTPRCSAFLGSTATPGDLRCSACQISICSMCKQPAHPGETCDDSGTKKLNALARDRQWAKCPACSTIVERISGCDNIYCRCGRTFSYMGCACKG